MEGVWRRGFLTRRNRRRRLPPHLRNHCVFPRHLQAEPEQARTLCARRPFTVTDRRRPHLTNFRPRVFFFFLLSLCRTPRGRLAPTEPISISLSLFFSLSVCLVHLHLQVGMRAWFHGASHENFSAPLTLYCHLPFLPVLRCQFSSSPKKGYYSWGGGGCSLTVWCLHPTATLLLARKVVLTSICATSKSV